MKKGKILIAGGLLLIAAALFLTAHNIYEAMHAGDEAEMIRKTLEQEIRKNVEAGAADREETDVQEMAEMPLYEQYPDMEMPVEVIDGWEYIGVLEISALDLVLPVMSEWSYPALRKAPCRYKGSAYSHDLILAGHNYSSHFGNLKTLALGDEIVFTDVLGNRFVYELADREELPGTAVEDMEAGDWDLTLFTCTLGGRSRVTLRCELAEDIPAEAAGE